MNLAGEILNMPPSSFAVFLLIARLSLSMSDTCCFVISSLSASSFCVMPRLGKMIAGDADSYRYLAESIRMHPDQETFAGMMRTAGFAKVTYENFTFGICALHIGTKSSAS